MIQIDKALLDDLFEKAKESDRQRMNYDLRTSTSDNSQRMLNAMLRPGWLCNAGGVQGMRKMQV